MAITEKYANFGLATGSNDGTSEADAWQTPADIIEAAGERVNVKTTGGSYTVGTSWASSAAGSATQPVLIRGYSSTIGDGSPCILDGSIANIFNFSGKYTFMEDFDVVSTSGTSSVGSTFSAPEGIMRNVKFVKTTTGAYSANVISSANSAMINCYIEGRGNTSSTTPVVSSTGIIATTAVKSTNGQEGVSMSGSFNSIMVDGLLVYSSVSTTKTGLELTGLVNASGMSISNFTIDGFDDGLLFDTLETARSAEMAVFNGIISGAVNAISTNEATTRMGLQMTDIAFYNNTNDDSAMGDNTVKNPIACSADPYEDSASGDFRPNSTAGGGALLQASAGFAAGVLTSGRDIGALQHADPAGGGGAVSLFNGTIQ